jgi:hypothetical protein
MSASKGLKIFQDCMVDWMKSDLTHPSFCTTTSLKGWVEGGRSKSKITKLNLECVIKKNLRIVNCWNFLRLVQIN